MSSALEHYESLLAEHYTWMFGMPPAVKAAEQCELLTRLEITSDGFAGGLAVDLGAGPGFQSMALSDMGFKRVLALDTSAKLLQELRSNCGTRPVLAIEDDMMNVGRHVAPATADLIVCMGDTLPHLPARELVPRLFVEVFRTLRSTGRFVLSFRDLSSELHGLDRFIPVRSDADKVMTCFLEYGPTAVMVHDLVHVREGDSWRLRKSSYPKLRLAIGEVRSHLEEAGLEVYAEETARGMCVLAARRP